MNPSLQQLAETLLRSETDNSTPSGGYPLDKNFSVLDFDKKSLSELHQKFEVFVDKAEAEITKLKGSDWSSIEDFYTGPHCNGHCLEHDFIATVNEYGCGFWEDNDWEPEVGEILTRLAKQELPIHCFVEGKTIYLDFI